MERVINGTWAFVSFVAAGYPKLDYPLVTYNTSTVASGHLYDSVTVASLRSEANHATRGASFAFEIHRQCGRLRLFICT